MVSVEICVDSPSSEAVYASVDASFTGGAATIELCGAMNLGGLSPETAYIRDARTAFRDRKGLVVMVRSRDGDFNFSEQEIDGMINQIQSAAEAGADGVAIGALCKPDNRIDTRTLETMLNECNRFGLTSTFHRAFDATPDPAEALDILIDYGVTRVLTSGLKWGSKGTALDGAAGLSATIKRARGSIEVVIGGSVSAAIAPGILSSIPLDIGPVSLHAYSSVLVNGLTDLNAVKTLVETAQSF